MPDMMHMSIIELFPIIKKELFLLKFPNSNLNMSLLINLRFSAYSSFKLIELSIILEDN